MFENDFDFNELSDTGEFFDQLSNKQLEKDEQLNEQYEEMKTPVDLDEEAEEEQQISSK